MLLHPIKSMSESSCALREALRKNKVPPRETRRKEDRNELSLWAHESSRGKLLCQVWDGGLQGREPYDPFYSVSRMWQGEMEGNRSSLQVSSLWGIVAFKDVSHEARRPQTSVHHAKRGGLKIGRQSRERIFAMSMTRKVFSVCPPKKMEKGYLAERTKLSEITSILQLVTTYLYSSFHTCRMAFISLLVIL